MSALINGDVVSEENVYSASSGRPDPAIPMNRIRGLAELLNTTPEYLLSPFKNEEERLLAARALDEDEDGKLYIPRSIWANAVRAAKVATKYSDRQTVADALKIMREAVAVLEEAYKSF